MSRFRKAASKLPRAQGIFPHDFTIAQALSLRVRQILADRATRNIPSLVIHTGDLTAAGLQNQFAVGGKFLSSHWDTPGVSYPIGLDLTPGQLVDIPGNHDLWFGGNQRYKKSFPAEEHRQFGDFYVAILGLDSNRDNKGRRRFAKGHIDGAQLDRACRLLNVHTNALLRIVALHHPLSDPPSGPDPSLRLEDREAIARRLRSAGADLVLAGHVHESFHAVETSDFPRQHVAGTACQMLSPHPCRFHVIDVFPPHRFIAARYDFRQTANTSFHLTAQSLL